MRAAAPSSARRCAAGSAASAAPQLGRADLERRHRGRVDAVEAARVLEHRGVAARAHVGEDRVDAGLDRAIGLGRIGEQRRQRGVEAVRGCRARAGRGLMASSPPRPPRRANRSRARIGSRSSFSAALLTTSRAEICMISSTSIERVRLQRVARGDQVDDRVGQAGERRQLHRAVELDQVDVDALVGEVIAGDARELGGDADARALLRGGRVVEVERRGDAHPAARDAEVERPVQALAAVLDQGVEADHAEVGAAVLHVGRHVAGADQDDAQVGPRGRDDEAPARLRGSRRGRCRRRRAAAASRRGSAPSTTRA